MTKIAETLDITRFFKVFNIFFSNLNLKGAFSPLLDLRGVPHTPIRPWGFPPHHPGRAEPARPHMRWLPPPHPRPSPVGRSKNAVGVIRAALRVSRGTPSRGFRGISSLRSGIPRSPGLRSRSPFLSKCLCRPSQAAVVF